MLRRLNSKCGFTLIELLIVMTVFVVIMMVTSSAMNVVLTKGNIVQRSEESSVEGIIGLEMLRHDLAQSGLGLFTDTNNPPIYSEAAGVVPATYNDSNLLPNNPRAVVTGNNLTPGDAIVLTNTDYLAIKSTTLGSSAAAQRWTYVTLDSTPIPNLPHLWGANDFVTGDRMIALKQTYDQNSGTVSHALVRNSITNGFEASYTADPLSTPIAGYSPPLQNRYYFYGINSAAGPVLRAPFNRADYYVRRPATGVTTACSPAAGVLFKAVMSHADGTMTPEIPILDCVADMQVVLGWNTQAVPEGSNAIDVLSSADAGMATATVTAPGGSGTNGLDIATIMQNPTEVRRRLRQIKVYLVVQDGARDPQFVNTNIAMQIADPGEGPLIRRTASANWVPGAADGTVNLTLTPNMLNYRWKVYRVVVKPKNLG